jgi:hypothetical protein
MVIKNKMQQKMLSDQPLSASAQKPKGSGEKIYKRWLLCVGALCLCNFFEQSFGGLLCVGLPQYLCYAIFVAVLFAMLLAELCH